MTPAGDSAFALSARLQGRKAALNLALATVAFALCFSVWGLIAPLAKGFQDDLALSSTETLFLTAIPVVLGSLLRIPMGLLTDRLGGRKVFSFLLAFSALPALLFGYAGSYWALVGVAFLLGVAGSSFAVGIPFVAGWYGRERQGLALGIYGMGNIGTAVAAFSAPAVVTAFGRPALGLATAFLLLAAASSFALLAADPPRRGAPARYRQVALAGWRLYRLALFYVITFGGFVAMALLLPKLLADWFSLSLVDAGLRAAGFTVAATLARPAGGFLADRLGAYPVLVLAFAGIAVDAAVLAAVAARPDMVSVTLACLTLACFLGAGNGAVFKLVPHEFPRDAGAAAGIVGAAGGLGGFFPPLLMGAVKDLTGAYTLGFVGLLAATALCLAAAVWLLRTAPPEERAGTLRPARPVSPAAPGEGAPSAVPDIRSGDPAFAFDDSLTILSWNSAAERLTGIPAREAVGRPCWEVLCGVDERGGVVCRPGCLGARHAGTGWPMATRELLIRTSGGRRRVMLSTVALGDAARPLYLHLMQESRREGTPQAGQD